MGQDHNESRSGPRARPLLRDVASLARVGTGTVSRVLNNSGPVAEETRQRVLDAVTKLGYRPDPFARGLRSRSTRLIGLILPDLLNEFYAQASTVIAEKLVQAGFQLLVSTANTPQQELAALESLADMHVDGIINVPSSNEVTLPDDIPIVQLNRYSINSKAPAVLCDEQHGFFELMNLVLHAGHRDIAIVIGNPHHSTTRERLNGMRLACAPFGLVVPEQGGVESPAGRVQVLCGEYSQQWGESAIDEIFNADTASLTQKTNSQIEGGHTDHHHRWQPSVIVASSPRIASGVVCALSRHNIRIPEDISVVAYDDPQWYSLWSPGMTALVAPMSEMGALAAELLLKRIAGEEIDSRNHYLTAHIERRGSLIERSCQHDS
ncbi:LacI family DNA-binding transcriptional regulator [Trueperella sp. LYQ141]|uniref:LacI family DNA-binding transcriptional regulator n=1 Tax=Trueperella sp. LYQ141 TaxID=3391058 RepID=UPI0039837BD6